MTSLQYKKMHRSIEKLGDFVTRLYLRSVGKVVDSAPADGAGAESVPEPCRRGISESRT